MDIGVLANASTLPVTRSSNRTPRAINRSQSRPRSSRKHFVHAEHIEQRIFPDGPQTHHGHGDRNPFFPPNPWASLASEAMMPPRHNRSF